MPLQIIKIILFIFIFDSYEVFGVLKGSLRLFVSFKSRKC